MSLVSVSSGVIIFLSAELCVMSVWVRRALLVFGVYCLLAGERACVMVSFELFATCAKLPPGLIACEEEGGGGRELCCSLSCETKTKGEYSAFGQPDLRASRRSAHEQLRS